MADGTTLNAVEETVKKLEQTAAEHSQRLDDHQQTLVTLNSMLTTLDTKFDRYIALLTEKFGALPPPAVEQTEVLSDGVDDEDSNRSNAQLVTLEELVEGGLLTKEELPKPIDAECVGSSTVVSPLFSHAHRERKSDRVAPILSPETLDIPDFVKIKVNTKVIEVEGPRGKLVSNFKHLNLDFQLIKDDETRKQKLKVSAWLGSRTTTATEDLIDVFSSNLYVAYSLVDMYGKIGEMESVRMVFEKMTGRSLVSWTAHYGGYVKYGGFVVANELFDELINLPWWIPWSVYWNEYGFALCCTCFEMRDVDEQHVNPQSSPEGFLKQLLLATRICGISLEGENYATNLDDMNDKSLSSKPKNKLHDPKFKAGQDQRGMHRRYLHFEDGQQNTSGKGPDFSNESLVLFQFHDGVTGTAKNHVVEDYGTRMHLALQDLQIFMAKAIEVLLGVRHEKNDQNPSQFEPAQVRSKYDVQPVHKPISAHEGTVQTVVLFNPLEQTRNEIVMVAVERPNVTILDSNWTCVKSQISPEFHHDGRKIFSGRHRVYRKTSVPALGLQIYYVANGFVGCGKAKPAQVKIFTSNHISCPAPYVCSKLEGDFVEIRNRHQTLNFSLKLGLLQKISGADSSQISDVVEEIGSVVTCKAIISKTIRIEMEEEDRNRTWAADAEAYNSKGLIGEYPCKKADLKTISEIRVEDKRKVASLLCNLTSALEVKNKKCEERKKKMSRTEVLMSNVMQTCSGGNAVVIGGGYLRLECEADFSGENIKQRRISRWNFNWEGFDWDPFFSTEKEDNVVVIEVRFGCENIIQGKGAGDQSAISSVVSSKGSLQTKLEYMLLLKAWLVLWVGVVGVLSVQMAEKIHHSFLACEANGIHANPQLEATKLGIDFAGDIAGKVELKQRDFPDMLVVYGCCHL